MKKLLVLQSNQLLEKFYKFKVDKKEKRCYTRSIEKRKTTDLIGVADGNCAGCGLKG